jgi:16S rRNA C1402 N4-methylase RsmH
VQKRGDYGNSRDYALQRLARDADGDEVKAAVLDDLLVHKISVAEANRRAGYVHENSLHMRNRNTAKSALIRLSVDEVNEILVAYCERHNISEWPFTGSK